MPAPVRRRQEHVGTDQGRRVPGLGVPQRDGERPQDAARPLEPVELRPAGVEEVGQIGVEGIPAGEALLGAPAVFAHDVVDCGEVADGGRHVRQEGVRIRDRRGREEAPAQHLGHVLLLDRLDPFLLLSIEDLADLGADRLAGVVALVQVRGEQRGHERAAVDLRHRLAQILKEVEQPAAPRLVHRDLAAREHQHLVDQHQRRQPRDLGPGQQIDQQRLGGRRLALLVPSLGVQRPDPGRAGDLESEHAPGMLQPAQLALRPAYLHPLLDVQLVEGERRDPGRRQRRADIGLELLHRGQARQRRRIVREMAQRHQRVGLAAAVGQLELPHRLRVPARETQHDVPRELAQRERRIGEREKPGGVLVYRPRASLHHHVVQVGGEVGQRQLAGAHVLAQFHDAVPGGPGELLRHLPISFVDARFGFRRSSCLELQCRKVEP